MAKCLKGLDVHLKVLSTKATHSKIPRAITDFPDRPKLKDDSILTAVGNTLTSKQNQHYV